MKYFLILSLALCTGLISAQAQTPMEFHRVLTGNSSSTNITLDLDPFAIQRTLDSIQLLHERMAIGLEGGSITGVANSVTVETFLRSKGSITIDGVSNLDTTNVDGQLTVIGVSNLDTTTVDGQLTVDGVSNLDTTTVDGQLIVKASAAGNYNDDNIPAISIELEGTESPHRNTNFIEFSSGDHALGRVEGQNMPQEWISYGDAFEQLLVSGATGLASTAVNTGMDMISETLSTNDNNAAYDTFSDGQSPTDAFNSLLGTFTTDFGLGLVGGSITIVKDIGNTIASIWGACYLGAGCDDIVTALFDLIDDASNLGLHVYGSYGWEGAEVGNGGIAFESVGADYAEWLEKEVNSDLLFSGDVVGVRGGKISKSFDTAERFMVISTNPTVIGAMPNPSLEQNFARVAFMGQVPTKVTGLARKGDFILPSGNNDGLAIAVAPSAMRTADYRRIIGTAWGNSFGHNTVSMINVAVGLNDNLLAAQVEKLEATLSRVESAISKLDPDYEASMPQQKNLQTFTKANSKQSSIRKKLSAQRVSISGGNEKTEDKLKSIFAEAQVLALESGVDLTKLPYLAEVFADPLNLELRKEATDYLNKRQAQLRVIEGSLHAKVQSKAKAADARGENVEVDPYFMLKPVNK